MRLIDADKADVEQISCFYGSECRLADVKEWLDEQPTIDIAKQIFDEIEVYEKDFSTGDIDGHWFVHAIDKMRKKYMENKND